MASTICSTKILLMNTYPGIWWHYSHWVSTIDILWSSMTRNSSGLPCKYCGYKNRWEAGNPVVSDSLPDTPGQESQAQQEAQHYSRQVIILTGTTSDALNIRCPKHQFCLPLLQYEPSIKWTTVTFLDYANTLPKSVTSTIKNGKGSSCIVIPPLAVCSSSGTIILTWKCIITGFKSWEPLINYSMCRSAFTQSTAKVFGTVRASSVLSQGHGPGCRIFKKTEKAVCWTCTRVK